MELRTTRDTRRNAPVDKIMGRKAEAQDAPAGAQPPQRKEPVDKLTLSRQAVAFVEEQSRKMWDEVREREQRRQSRMNSAGKPANSELDLLDQGLKVLELCQKIAASIMKGDKVPPEDLKFLMENDPDGYRLAMAMRRHKEDPEEVDSVLEDEENRDGSAEGAETPSVEAAGPGELHGRGFPAIGAFGAAVFLLVGQNTLYFLRVRIVPAHGHGQPIAGRIVFHQEFQILRRHLVPLHDGRGDLLAQLQHLQPLAQKVHLAAGGPGGAVHAALPPLLPLLNRVPHFPILLLCKGQRLPGQSQFVNGLLPLRGLGLGKTTRRLRFSAHGFVKLNIVPHFSGGAQFQVRRSFPVCDIFVISERRRSLLMWSSAYFLLYKLGKL